MLQSRLPFTALSTSYMTSNNLQVDEDLSTTRLRHIDLDDFGRNSPRLVVNHGLLGLWDRWRRHDGLLDGNILIMMLLITLADVMGLCRIDV